MERIEQAAIRWEGKVYTAPRPARHGDVFKANCEVVNGIVRGKILGGEQGFVTDAGRFVNRKEAYQIATSQGQVTERRPGGYDGNDLYTEDLW